MRIVVFVAVLAAFLIFFLASADTHRRTLPRRKLAHVAFKSDLESRECARAGRTVLPLIALVVSLAMVWLVWTFVSNPIAPRLLP